MSLPDVQKLYEVTEATWPAFAQYEAGGFVIREGRGGGKRVCAATAEADFLELEIDRAEHEMAGLGQAPLFMLRDGENELDQRLQERGYEVIDPVNLYAIAAEALATEEPPRTVAIPAWEPLKIMEEIWAAGGIGPARIDVMKRACSPKTGLVSRFNDQPAGASFMAMHQGISMLHSLEILPEHRRHGLGRWVMRRAGFWTLAQGGHTVSVLCTQANDAANALYQNLGMSLIGTYHYRIKSE